MDRFLIVGLGNPGRNYRENRHNLGFMVVDKLAEKYAISLNSVKSKAIVGNGRVFDRPVILAKPQTYMNLSGDSVGPVAAFYKIPPENVLVIYDELDLPFGTIRLREQGGAGGHNGMKSIINHLGQGFPRVRLGIGRPPGRMDPAAWVLRDFGDEERPLLNEILAEAIQAIETYLAEGIQLAMSRHNKRLNDE
ncbi:MAG: aminoacyl-tRNA hydrolase [Anaerolineales bacterium]|nr:aminoacyl-tRNA hydrolase [Anaerolineales bacterium]MCB8989806.1 aminoacyl-tRNA hydrolase [Ardenticatenaceae bacterium]MCB9003982.1 aminoacyl-tRNA hydrolase [Ardenticatenaceae bacterium]